MNRIIVIIFMAIIFLISFRLGYTGFVEITGDKVVYDESSKKIIADNNVEITSGSLKIKGQHVEYDMDKHYILAVGTVQVTDRNFSINGDRVEYNMSSSTNYIYNAYGYMEPWYFKSDKAVKQGDIIYMGKSKMTSCNLRKPHYYLSMESAVVIPGKGIKTNKDIVYVGNVPIFYMPSYYHAVGDRPSSWQVQPSYNSRDGLVLKGIYSFPVSRSSYSKLYLDLLTRQGIGKGIEYNYTVPAKVKGSVYAYHIREENNGTERWKFSTSHWQNLSKTWFMQGNINFQSDEYFNQYYFTESWDRQVKEASSDLAFTKQTSKTNLRISFDRIDIASGPVYNTSQLTTPRINFTLFTMKPGFLPVYIGFSNETLRQYTLANGYTVWDSTSNFFITREIPLLKKTIFTPKVGILELWQSDVPSMGYDSFFQSRYYSQLVLRQRIGRFSNIEFSHNYKIRSRPNVTRIDSEMDDYGIEENNVTTVLYNAIGGVNFVRFTTLYNLRNYRSYTIENNLLRFDPLTTEVNLFLNKISVYLKHRQKIDPFTMADVQTDVGYTLKSDTRFSIGGYYSTDLPGMLQLRNSIYFWMGKKWHIGLDLVTNVSQGQYSILDQKLKIYRDLHCWQTDFSYNKRGEVDEFAFNIGLKFAKPSKDRLVDKKLEEQFYPWR